MAERSTELQAFLDALEAALRKGAAGDSAPAAAIAKAFKELETPGAAASPDRAMVGVCAHLPAAIDTARKQPTADLGAAFARIEPNLAWRIRPDRKSDDPNFADAHANAIVVGEGGLEDHSGVRIGVSLLAPNTHYPDHHHPPEEVYVALSNGAWRQNDGPWKEPGQGGLVYNPPDIIHAMQSGDEPLLAIWTLPM